MANTSHFKRRVPCGRVLLGGGMPKICVPLMGKSPQEMRALTDAAVHSGADVLEWRIISDRIPALFFVMRYRSGPLFHDGKPVLP